MNEIREKNTNTEKYISKINKKKIYEQIADEIKKLIITNQIKPNEKLPSERELAKCYGVSVPTVRQALAVVSSFGFIRILHGSGVYVNENYNSNYLRSVFKNVENHVEIGIDIFIQLTEMRKMFECQNAFLAAINHTKDDLIMLSELLEKHKNSAKNLDYNLADLLDVEFHLGIAKASHNIFIESFFESISNILLRMISTKKKIPEFLHNTTISHSKIFDAIEKNNPKKASKLMEEHISVQEKRLHEFFGFKNEKKALEA
jgi:GntR family transcriptional repressor for pyruvate dehydrogenase complex